MLEIFPVFFILFVFFVFLAVFLNTVINLLFMVSGLHRIFRKQLPIFMVSFPESSKYLPVPFVYSSLYEKGQRGNFLCFAGRQESGD